MTTENKWNTTVQNPWCSFLRTLNWHTKSLQDAGSPSKQKQLEHSNHKNEIAPHARRIFMQLAWPAHAYVMIMTQQKLSSLEPKTVN